MKFRVVWIGSNADSEFREAIDRYASRIRHFYSLEIIELPSEKDRQKKTDAAIIRAQSERLAAAILPGSTVVVLDERGDSTDSLKFARWVERLTINSPHGATFLLGGDLGLDDAIRARADKVLSLSAMTLPHQLARVVLLEQIYRACTVIRNIRYHK